MKIFNKNLIYFSAVRDFEEINFSFDIGIIEDIFTLYLNLDLNTSMTDIFSIPFYSNSFNLSTIYRVSKLTMLGDANEFDCKFNFHEVFNIEYVYLKLSGFKF